MDQPEAPYETNFSLTHKQKRLRSVALVIILVEMGMLFTAYSHPFFHPHKPQIMTESIRKALAVQGLMMLAFYALCFALSLSLLVIAWLYVREVRMQLAVAKLAVWREVASQGPNDQENRKNGKHG